MTFINEKEIVRAGYDNAGECYTSSRSKEIPKQLLEVITELPARTRVLDVGCGRGLPITRALSQKFEVIGVDLSAENIRVARTACPDVHFINADITDLQFDDETFTLIVAFYVITHLSAEDQFNFLKMVKQWLTPNGVLVCTLEHDYNPDYVKESFLGQKMYWHSLGLAEYHRLFKSVGLRIVKQSEVSSGYQTQLGLSEKTHPIVFARRN